MANLSISIADGTLTIYGGGRTEQYTSADYRAKTWRNGDRDGLVIFPLGGTSEPYARGTFTFKDISEFSLYVDGALVSLADAIDAIDAFNNAAGTNFGFNTQYPQHIISGHIELDTSVATQLTTYEKAGYLTIKAHADNADVVYIGDEDVDTISFNLVADSSISLELDDLSKIYAFGGIADLVIDVIGAYKY